MQNLKITLKLGNYAVLANNPLDGLLAKLWFEEQKQKGTFDGNYYKQIPFIEFDKEGFYHISNPVYESKLMLNQVLHKSFDAKDYALRYPHTKVNDTLFNAGGGVFKMYANPFEKHLIDDVVFYVKGDLQKIKQLLSNLKSIGKKSAYGWGKIEKIVIETIDKNCSIVKNGKLMRHVPHNSRYLSEAECKTGVRLMQLTHPYWDRGREVYCAVAIDTKEIQ